MNTRDEMAGNSVSSTTWCGFDKLRLTDDAHAVDVTIGSMDRWDRSHLRRLRQSADLPGLIPVIDSDFSSDGKPFAVTPVLEESTLADLIPPSGDGWEDCAAITEAAARAAHEAHLRGLFHGSLSPDQIFVIGDDVAVNGIGLGLGGTPSAEYGHWVAPEVSDGSDATERSDVFSLGKILEASLGDSIDDAPRSVRRLIMWSSSDTPEARPPSALEFASILAEALGDDRKTYSPAFIPTAETNDLASTASGSVAAFVPSAEPTGSGAAVAGVAGAAAIGGAAAVASFSSDDMEDAVEGDLEDAIDDGDIDAEVEDLVEVDTSELPTDLDTSEDVMSDAVDTGELPAGVAAEAAVTSEVEDDFEAAAPALTIDEEAAITEDVEGDGYDMPAAAQTVDLDEDDYQERRSNRAGMLVGAILAAGLAVVAYGLITSGGDDTDTTGGESEAAGPSVDDEGEDGGAVAGDEDEQAEDATTDESTNDAPTTSTTEEASTSEAGATDETSESDENTETATNGEDEEDESQFETTASDDEEEAEEEAPTEDDAPAEEEAPEAAEPGPTLDGPISADEAGVQVLHGIPDTDVDVYVNGEAFAPGFTAGTIAGPADLPPGAYDIAVYAASDTPPAAADDRTDEPIVASTVNVGSDPATLVAHLDADGIPTLSAFVEDLDELEPAQGRVELRHLAFAPAVKAVIDGEEIDGMLAPGTAAALSLPAGDHTIEALTESGDTVASAPITLGDGELISISVFGSAEDDSITIAVQRYTGLAAAPADVPTGDSNLLGTGDDTTGLYLLGVLTALLAAAGAAIMMRRGRQVL